jgi:hypothetical protein
VDEVLGWIALGLCCAFWLYALIWADKAIDPQFYDTDPDDPIEIERREWM